MPVFAVFFPVETAVALTAVVHFLNNLFKLILVGTHADITVVIRFGLPALAAAFAGAEVLIRLAALPALMKYDFFLREADIRAEKLVIALIMIGFGVWEFLPASKTSSFDRKFLPIGGILSGFFGGLSGHQGALRSAFLVPCGLSKEAFVATGVMIACLVDTVRLSVYGTHLLSQEIGDNSLLLVTATLSAFAGAWLGSRLLRKVALQNVHTVVALMLLVIAAGLASGVI